MRRAAPAALIAALAAADPDTHYNDLPVGERAAGMGGAFTALADEATGMHYNPAGPALFERDTLSLAMSAYRYRRTTAKKLLNLCDEQVDIDESQFFTFPGSFGLVKGLGTKLRQAIGFTVLVPDNVVSRMLNTVDDIDCPDVDGAIDFAQSTTNVDRTLWFGLGYAVRPVSWLAVGAGPVVVLRTAHYDSTIAVRVGGLPAAQIYEQLDGTVWTAAAQAGALALLGRLRVGLALRSPTVEFAQSARAVFTDLGAAPPYIRAEEDDVDLRFPLPLRAALGVAWVAPGGYSLSADVSYHARLAEYLPWEAGAREAPPNVRDPVVNAAVGGEWWVTPSVDLLAGFFTNRSSYPQISRSHRDYPHIDYYGLTLGSSWMSKRATLTFVLQTMVGFGQIMGLDAETAEKGLRPPDHEVDITDLVLTALIGGSFDL